MTAPAVTSDYFVKHPSLFLEAAPLKKLASPATANVLKLMALGEIVGDKLPNTPNRTAPGALGARRFRGRLRRGSVSGGRQAGSNWDSYWGGSSGCVYVSDVHPAPPLRTSAESAGRCGCCRGRCTGGRPRRFEKRVELPKNYFFAAKMP